MEKGREVKLETTAVTLSRSHWAHTEAGLCCKKVSRGRRCSTDTLPAQLSAKAPKICRTGLWCSWAVSLPCWKGRCVFSCLCPTSSLTPC